MKILGIAGKKQSGKNSSANYLTGYTLKECGAISDYRILDSGELNVLTNFQDGTTDWGVLDICRKDEEFLSIAEKTIFPFVKIYSFADSLKELAVNLFELEPEQVWGTDEQKNSLTHLKWSDMPGVYDGFIFDQHGNAIDRDKYYIKEDINSYMTGREFLQFFGTEIGRRIYSPIWINSTINKIVSEKSGLAIIADVRFPDEVYAIQNSGGSVIRLLRSVYEDNHPSEISLDETVFHPSGFDSIIDNRNLSMKETCEKVEKELKKALVL